MGSAALVEERIITGLVKILNKPAQVRKESRLVADLNLDSLDALDLIFELEEEFNIEIPRGDELRFVTVQDVITYVQEKTKGASALKTNPK